MTDLFVFTYNDEQSGRGAFGALEHDQVSASADEMLELE